MFSQIFQTRVLSHRIEVAVAWASLVGVDGHVGFTGRDGNWTMVRNQVHHPVASLRVSLGTSTHLPSAPFQQCHAKHPPLQGPVGFVGPVFSIVRPLFSKARVSMPILLSFCVQLVLTILQPTLPVRGSQVEPGSVSQCVFLGCTPESGNQLEPATLREYIMRK